MSDWDGTERRHEPDAKCVEYAKQTARQVLREIGLDDENAAEDIRQIRLLLSNFRLMQKTFRTTSIRIFTISFWLLLLAGLLAWLKEHFIP